LKLADFELNCNVTSGSVLRTYILCQQKGQDRGGRWVHPKGANIMTVSGLVCRNALVGTSWAISLLLCMTRLGKVFWSCGSSISQNEAFILGLYGQSLAESHDY